MNRTHETFSDKRPANIQTVRDVLTNGAVKLRFAEDSKPWTLDHFTASAMITVFDALSAENQEKVSTMIRTKRGFMKYLDFCWKQVKAA